MTNLTKIANKHNTDKGTVAYEAHGYTEEYSKYIPDKGKFTLLEIGYYHGDSARMWKEYNNSLSLAFIDIDRNCVNYNKEHSNLYIGDAKNPKLIREVIEDYEIEGGFDYVIDDGSHRYEDILASFKLLYPRLKKGGYYFIEDLHAGQAQVNDLFNSLSEYLINIGDREKWLHREYLCNGKLLIIKK